MRTIDKWAERIYSETDFGRGVATSVAGVVALVVYLAIGDGVIAALAWIISFPIIRLLASGWHERATRRAKHGVEREEAERIYDVLSEEERRVVAEFVRGGGSVLTWSHINQMSLGGPAIESLIQRSVLCSSVTADGMTETFVLNQALFDVGRARSQTERPKD